MTPKDLRERSIQFIASARSNLHARRFENASHDAGFAAELALKARYCTKHGWSSWPNSIKEFLALGGQRPAFSHGLDDLLRLSDSAQIPQFASIDWNGVASWDVNDRYSPTGSADQALVSQRVEDTAKLCIGLAHHELIRIIRTFHIAEATANGWFNLFTLEELPGRPELALRVAARWIADQADAHSFSARAREFREQAVPTDLALLWAGTGVIDVDDMHTLHINALFCVRGPETIVRPMNIRSSGGHVADQYILASGDERRPPLAGNVV